MELDWVEGSYKGGVGRVEWLRFPPQQEWLEDRQPIPRPRLHSQAYTLSNIGRTGPLLPPSLGRAPDIFWSLFARESVGDMIFILFCFVLF